MVTELGIGAMDTPQAAEGRETLIAALNSGISFIDTAREYQGSEFLIGEAIRAVGARSVCLASKTFKRTRDGSQYDVDRSKQVLGVEKVHLYQLHDVSSFEVWEEVMGEGGALEGLQTARFRGLIDYIGISSHRLDVLEEAIGSGEFDTVMLEYSAFFPETKELARLASDANIGVIAMRPPGRVRKNEQRESKDRGKETAPLHPPCSCASSSLTRTFQWLFPVRGSLTGCMTTSRWPIIL